MDKQTKKAPHGVQKFKMEIVGISSSASRTSESESRSIGNAGEAIYAIFVRPKTPGDYKVSISLNGKCFFQDHVVRWAEGTEWEANSGAQESKEDVESKKPQQDHQQEEKRRQEQFRLQQAEEERKRQFRQAEEFKKQQEEEKRKKHQEEEDRKKASDSASAPSPALTDEELERRLEREAEEQLLRELAQEGISLSKGTPSQTSGGSGGSGGPSDREVLLEQRRKEIEEKEKARQQLAEDQLKKVKEDRQRKLDEQRRKAQEEREKIERKKNYGS